MIIALILMFVIWIVLPPIAISITNWRREKVVIEKTRKPNISSQTLHFRASMHPP